MLDASGLAFGRYVLKERIAAGGMGEVYLGVQTGIGQFQRPVAVKLLLPHLSDDASVVGMFLQEARLGAQMSHPNVAQVYDVGLEHDRYFIAMELVRGVSLSRLIAGLKGAKELLSPELVAYVGRCLCEGLHVAHEMTTPEGRPLSLVHRDVTPHNVLVSVDGAVKLTDFGIARVAESDRVSRPGVVLGKLGYLAPEQITGSLVDRRVDVFAAGATLYHLAALEKPFDTPTGQLLDPGRLPQAPLRVLRPDLPRPMVDAIEQAMQPDVGKRLQTAKELRAALPPAPEELPEVLGRLVRRICAQDIIELEEKTQRAQVAAQQPDTQPDRPAVKRRAPGEKATPGPAAGKGTAESAMSLPPVMKSRTPAVVVAVLGVAVVAGLAWWGMEARETPPQARSAGVGGGGGVTPPLTRPAADLSPLPQGEVRPADAGAPDTTPGLLALDATPWATVTLDARSLGETPLANVRVAPGAHTLVFKNPDTGRSAKRVVQVQPGKPLAVRVDLR